MQTDKSSISQAQNYQEIGEFWDSHDLGDYWDQTESAEFTVEIVSQSMYYPIETELSAQLKKEAAKHGVPATTLVNLWLQERMLKEASAK